MKMKIFEECYTLSNGAKIPKMGLGTWFIPDETEAAEWNMESIMKRDVRIADIIMKKLLKWNANYMQFYSDELIEDKPSEEDLARIAEFRKKGWIQNLRIFKVKIEKCLKGKVC